MHELGLTLEIVELAGEGARGRPVRRVILEVGDDAGVMPDALRFCFDLCIEGTPLEGAILEIIASAGQELKIRALEVEA